MPENVNIQMHMRTEENQLDATSI